MSWKVYQEIDNYGFNVLEYFDNYQNASTSSPLYQNAMRFYQAGQFEYDAINDRLPTVSYILPTSYQSEHPDFMPAAGADYVKSKLDAIAANPDVWAKTLFILIYDENDGYFDHVLPPTAPGWHGRRVHHLVGVGREVRAGPIGLGFRVPCILVSPWTVGGFVCHDTFDHTSVTRLLELVTGVVNPNITAWRRQTVGDFTTRARHRPRTAGSRGCRTPSPARAGRTGSSPVPAAALPGSEPDPARPAARIQAGARRASRRGRSGSVTEWTAASSSSPSRPGPARRDRRRHRGRGLAAAVTLSLAAHPRRRGGQAGPQRG